MENITLRTKNIPNKNIDTVNSSLDSELDASEVLNSTQYDSISSLPKSTENIESLYEQIASLTRQLTFFEGEISKLTLEISNMQKQLTESQKRCELYKNFIESKKLVCPSPSTTPKSRKSKKSKKSKKNTNNLPHSASNTNQTPSKTLSEPTSPSRTLQSSNTPSPTMSHKEELHNRPQNRNHKSKQHLVPIQSQDSCIPNQKTEPNRIFILGDQQLRGLSSEMYQSRLNTQFKHYTFDSLIKPDASSSEILKTCTNLHKNMNREDVLIIGVGSNDENPYQLFSELCNILNLVKNIKVFVVSVYNNPYLNISLLNNNIKLLLKNFDNCTFIDLNQYRILTKKALIYNLSSKLNTEIDFLCYKNKYLNLNSLYRTPAVSYNGKITRKGTIPYYFKLQEMKNTKLKCNKSSTMDICPKIGTIPYYFQLITKKEETGKPSDKTVPQKTCFR